MTKWIICVLTCFLIFTPIISFGAEKVAHKSIYGAKTPIVESNTVIVDRVKSVILYFSERYGADPDLAIAIAKIESNFDPKAKNPSSTAKGVFQFLDSTWKKNCGGNVYDPVDNVSCAVHLLSEGGIGNWLASAPTRNALISMGYQF